MLLGVSALDVSHGALSDHGALPPPSAGLREDNPPKHSMTEAADADEADSTNNCRTMAPNNDCATIPNPSKEECSKYYDEQEGNRGCVLHQGKCDGSPGIAFKSCSTALRHYATKTDPGYVNRPVKSINLAAAPDFEFFKLASADKLGDKLGDPHAQTGIQTADGGFAIVGKGVKSAEALPTQAGQSGAFAAKLNAHGETQWAWESVYNGFDMAVNLVQLPQPDGSPGGDLMVVGFRTVDGTPFPSITLLEIATGKETWTTLLFQGDGSYVTHKNDPGLIPDCTANLQSDPDCQSLKYGGLAASIDINGESVVISGMRRAKIAQLPTPVPAGFVTFIQFHSAGNPEPGEANAFVAKLPFTALMSGAAPTDADFAWVYESSKSFSYANTVRFHPGGDAVATLTSFIKPGVPEAGGVVRLAGDTGARVWGPHSVNTTVGALEPTDFKVSEDGSFLLFGGMTAWNSTGVNGKGVGTPTSLSEGTTTGGTAGIAGLIAKVDANDGYTVIWAKRYGVGNDPLIDSTLLLNECWGITETPGGGVFLSCAVGIEGGSCNGVLTGQTSKADCLVGKVDTRPGAVDQPPNMWSMLSIQTDANGELLWQRVDGRKGEGGKSVGSAGEFPITCSDGSVAVVVDDVLGCGVAKYKPR